MTEKKGLFVTVEGVEGAGKSTAISFVKQYLESREVDFLLTREPGGTEIAEAIRQILLNNYSETMAVDTELLLFFASRAQHIAQVIKPALKEGQLLICDRFTDASFAYQCGGRGIAEERIATLENWVLGELRPDITILLDVPVEVGLSRIRARGNLDRIEVEQLHFFERVRENYLERAARYSDRYRVVDASVPLDQMNAALLAIIEKEII